MRILVLFLCLGLTACATATKYQPQGRSGGYRDRQVGDNKYLVRFGGNGYTSQLTVEDYAFRRAQELCVEHGYKAYNLLNKNGQTVSQTSDGDCNGNKAYCYGGDVSTYYTHVVELLIECITKA